MGGRRCRKVRGRRSGVTVAFPPRRHQHTQATAQTTKNPFWVSVVVYYRTGLGSLGLFSAYVTLPCDSAILDKKLIYIPSSHFSGLAANFTYLPPLLVSKPTTHLIYIPPACFQTNNTSYIHTPPLRSVVMQHNMQDATPPITLFTPYECMQIWPIWSRLVWYMTNI